jgi:hypothetical protein
MFERHDFLTMFPHTVNIYRQTGVNKHGSPVHAATPVAYRARITGKTLAVRRYLSEQDSVVFDVFVDAGTDIITHHDKLELPDNDVYVERYPEVYAIDRVSDEDGAHHLKIQCGWVYHRQGQ